MIETPFRGFDSHKQYLYEYFFFFSNTVILYKFYASINQVECIVDWTPFSQSKTCIVINAEHHALSSMRDELYKLRLKNSTKITCVCYKFGPCVRSLLSQLVETKL